MYFENVNRIRNIVEIFLLSRVLYSTLERHLNGSTRKARKAEWIIPFSCAIISFYFLMARKYISTYNRMVLNLVPSILTGPMFGPCSFTVVRQGPIYDHQTDSS